MPAGAWWGHHPSMAKLYTEIELLDPATLTPYRNNSKRHPQAQIDRLAAQIAAHGFDQPIVVDLEGVIVKGHGRRQAAMQLGLETVPVVISELDEHQARAARIADNQLVSLEYDTKALEAELSRLQAADVDLELTGLGGDQIEQLLRGGGEEEGERPTTYEQEGGGGGDEPSPPVGDSVRYIAIGALKVPTDQEEMDALIDRCRAYESAHGTTFGFWSALLGRA